MKSFPLSIAFAVSIAGVISHSLAQEADPFSGGSTETKILTLDEKLSQTLIPDIDFEDVPLDSCLDFLRTRSRELDPTSDPNLKGVNIVVRPIEQKAGVFSRIPVSLKSGEISLGKALDAVAKEAGKIAWKENHAVVIGGKAQKTEPSKIPDDTITKAMVAKLKAMNVGSAEFQNTPLTDALSWILGRLSVLQERDPKSSAFSIDGIEIKTVGKITVFDSFFKKEMERRIDLNLSACNAFDLYSHLAAQAGLGIKWGPNTITLVGD